VLAAADDPPPPLKYMLVDPSATAASEATAFDTDISMSSAQTCGSSAVAARPYSDGFEARSRARRSGAGPVTAL